MEQLEIMISISKSDKNLKVIKENYQGKMSSLINALKKVKEETNNYLTELVNEEKEVAGDINEKNIKMNTKNFNIEQDDQGDEDLEEDYVDIEIKKELSVGQKSSFSSDIMNDNVKRIKTIKGTSKFKK